MKESAKRIFRHCALLIGRRNLYRASRFFMNAARGDIPNDPLSNGERMVQEVCIRLASPQAMVFDVGANVGNWTAGVLETSNRLGIEVQVHAFEPCRGNFDKLSVRAGNWTNVRIVKQACSRKPGTAKMNIYGSGAGTNSLVEPIDDSAGSAEEVRLTTIDDYCRKASIRKINLLKIDAEGHDFEVIAGATRMLESHSVLVLQFEYNQRWIGARNYLRDVFSLLGPMGYRIGKLTGGHVEFYPSWHWEMESYREANYVVCREETAQRFPNREPRWIPLNGAKA